MKTSLLTIVSLLTVCLLILGCDGNLLGPIVGPQGTENSSAPGENDADSDTAPDDEEEPDDDADSGGVKLSGRILLEPETGTALPRSKEVPEQPYTVVAQSDATGELFRVETDDNGDFELELPESEMGNTFVVSVLGPDSRAVGPVLMGANGTDGQTGVTMSRDAGLGTMLVPGDPTAGVMQPGSDGDVAELIDEDLTVRLNADGVPVGVDLYGRGTDAQSDGAAAERMVDPDRDGLIDVFDADDDGDGIVDDFDGDGDVGGMPADLNVNFFMNLKIDTGHAPTYYNGTTAEIEQRLAQDTVITFEVMNDTADTNPITSARLLETPGPAYLSTATLLGGAGGGLWSERDYAFTQNEETGRFEAFAVPNDLMTAGDSFTLEVIFADGTVRRVTRMINYVFKNIPMLMQYGKDGALTDFDATSTTINGDSTHPIPFDGSQDLVLVFKPPIDETGAYVTGMYYTFHMFYQSAGDGRQLNSEMDLDATFPTDIDGFESFATQYRVEEDELGTLSAENTYTVTLPPEIFPDQVTLSDGTVEDVAAYQVDITAEAPSGNAGLILIFEKQ